MTIVNDRLQGPRVSHYQTPNVYKPGQPLDPKLLVLHLTADTLLPSHNWFMTPNAVAAHVIVANDGSVRQYASFRERCPHVGVGWHPRLGWWPNNYSIGIEFENPANLTILGGGHYADWRKRPYTGKGVVEVVHEVDQTLWGWVPITGPQWETGIEIARLLGIPEIIGHDHLTSRVICQRAVYDRVWEKVEPYRLDPGPAIDMAAFRREVG